MAIITLISDWGDRGYYAAAVKGAVLSLMPEARIVDITHRIKAFNVAHAAWVLKNAFPAFPEGTVHIIAVNTEESMERPHTVVYYHKQYFIGADNGIFSLLLEEAPEKIISLNIPQEAESLTFSSRDRFVKAAVHLAGGGSLEELGELREAVNPGIPLKPIRDKDGIRGVIIHIDDYKNIITNISKKLLTEVVDKRPFQIQIRTGRVQKISKAYGDANPGDLVAIFSVNGLLEVAMNEGEAASLLGVKVGDAVIVEVTG